MADLTIRARWIGSDVERGIETLKSAALGLGVAFGLNELRQGMAAIIRDTAEEERGLQRMAVAMRNVGASGRDIQRINDYIGELQDTTQFADDAIVAAFTRMTQMTGDVSGSLSELNDAMDVAAATGMDLSEAGRVVAMAMTGQLRAIGQLLPSLKTYLENLEGVEDPATRAKLAIEALRNAFGGSAKEDIDTMSGAVDAFKNSISELGNVLAEKSGLLKMIQDMATAGRAWAISLREGITLAEAIAKMQTPAVAPQVGPAKGTFDNPFQIGGVNAVVGGAPIDQSAFGSILPGPNNRQRGDQFSNLADLLKEINTEVGTDYTQRMKEADEKFAEAHRQQMRAIGEELKSGLIGAFDAATQGGKAFVDYLKGYIKRELFEFFAGTLANLAVPGAGGTVGTGLLGHIFGGTGQSYQGIGAQQQSMNLRAARLG